MKLTVNVILCLLFCVLVAVSSGVAQTSWKGATSTSWTTASNWSNGVPGSGTPVIIGDANFTGANQPTISSAVTIASLTFNSNKASTLTLGAGGSLTVTGNVSGTWTVNATHTLIKMAKLN